MKKKNTKKPAAKPAPKSPAKKRAATAKAPPPAPVRDDLNRAEVESACRAHAFREALRHRRNADRYRTLALGQPYAGDDARIAGGTFQPDPNALIAFSRLADDEDAEAARAIGDHDAVLIYHAKATRELAEARREPTAAPTTSSSTPPATTKESVAPTATTPTRTRIDWPEDDKKMGVAFLNYLRATSPEFFPNYFPKLEDKGDPYGLDTRGKDKRTIWKKWKGWTKPGAAGANYKDRAEGKPVHGEKTRGVHHFDELMNLLQAARRYVKKLEAQNQR